MSFLSPLALSLFALSVPLVLLYFLKVRRRERTVSSLLLWSTSLRDRDASTFFQRLHRVPLIPLRPGPRPPDPARRGGADRARARRRRPARRDPRLHRRRVRPAPERGHDRSTGPVDRRRTTGQERRDHQPLDPEELLRRLRLSG